MKDLQCIYDTRKSFYGKAKIEIVKNSNDQTKDLYSYNTLVASCIYDFMHNKTTYKITGKYRQTTTRHQKEFFKQCGLNDEEIKDLFKNMVIVERW